MPRDAEWDDKLRFSDRDDDVEDVGYGGGSSYDDDDDEEGGWGSTKHQDDLWDEPEDAAQIGRASCRERV